ncbi:hypothetical protein AKJ16_DCAP16684 [Drosera capensis]
MAVLLLAVLILVVESIGVQVVVAVEIYTDLQTQAVIGGGREAQGLYHMNALPAALSAVTSIDCHRRLGHAPLSILRIMIPSFFFL